MQGVGRLLDELVCNYKVNGSSFELAAAQHLLSIVTQAAVLAYKSFITTDSGVFIRDLILIVYYVCWIYVQHYHFSRTHQCRLDLVWSLIFAVYRFRWHGISLFFSEIRGGTNSKTQKFAQKATQSQYKANNDPLLFANIARILFASWAFPHYDFACEWHFFPAKLKN
jgi:hypothetical protein